MNRFWKRNSQPLHDVTHRAIGDIPGCTMLPPIEDRYTGFFPSAAMCALNNEFKDKMKFFDDGERMVYGKAEPRIVPIEPCDVKHPITYPPPGFTLNTSADGEKQWVHWRVKKLGLRN